MNLVNTPHMDFPTYALLLAKARGDTVQAVELCKHTMGGTRPRVEAVLRAAVNAGTTSDANWASALVDHQLMIAAWAESLRSISVFDALLPFAKPVPLERGFVVVTGIIVGSTAAEGALKPSAKLELGSGGVAAKKAVAIVIAADELLRFATAIASGLINTELRAGVAAATNLQFLADLAAGIVPINSTGDPLKDAAASLAVVATHAAAKPIWIMSRERAIQTSTLSANGAQAHPGMTAQGGVLAGIPVIVSDQLPSDSLGAMDIIVDASQLAMASETVTLRASSMTALQMDDDPSPGAQSVVSLFQSDSTALLAERRFGSERLRDSAVVLISGGEYMTP